MTRIAKAFENGKAFIAFVTGGDPSPEKTVEFILAMEKQGADLIEIGVPFADPIAEGPVIQNANVRALAAGADINAMFGIVEAVREKSEIPLVFMGYVNTAFSYGYDAYFARCKQAGLDGVIFPDLPFDEKGELEPYAKKHGIDLISLVAPTSEDRISKIAKEASGFLYVVSSMGVTGMLSEIKTDLKSILDTVRASTDIPAAVGFGISRPDQAQKISQICDGVIVGSAIVKLCEEYGTDAAPHIYEYVKSMKDAIR